MPVTDEEKQNMLDVIHDIKSDIEALDTSDRSERAKDEYFDNLFEIHDLVMELLDLIKDLEERGYGKYEH